MMNLVRWQPRTLTRNHGGHAVSDWDHLFNWAFGPTSWQGNRALSPAVDVVEQEDRYLVRADLPGLNKDDIEITYQDGVLTLQGGQQETKEEENEKGHTWVRERFVGRFSRTLRLPEKVDVAKIEASFRDGVLELVLPFTPEAQPKRIEIR